jgi:hypothetical protein
MPGIADEQSAQNQPAKAGHDEGLHADHNLLICINLR